MFHDKYDIHTIYRVSDAKYDIWNIYMQKKSVVSMKIDNRAVIGVKFVDSTAKMPLKLILESSKQHMIYLFQ